jgi:citrate lyase beta subunit
MAAVATSRTVMATSIPGHFSSAMRLSLTPDEANALARRLAPAGPPLQPAASATPGDSRQPVHTVYGGAHLFRAGTAPKLGELALRALDQHAPDPQALSLALGDLGPPRLAGLIYQRIRAKLTHEPVEDFRIDFEDGYGQRRDDEEDAHALSAAAEVARGMTASTLPPMIGVRVKPLSAESHRRSLRTLDLFLTSLIETAGSSNLPPGFVLTLPKIDSETQVAVFAEALERLEARLGLAPRSLVFEMMIETPQAIFNECRGEIALAAFARAGAGRVVGAHLGIYDYTALLGIAGSEPRYRHPACDLVRMLMQIAYTPMGIRVSDSVTNIMPVGDTTAVHRAWRAHYDNIRHSLEMGIFQGWDLHPAQLVARYAAVYAFFAHSLDAASERLRSLAGRAAQASLLGNVFDDAAMGQGLLNFFLRGIACGAIAEDEVPPLTGLTLHELRSRSFVTIIQERLRSPAHQQPHRPQQS